MRPEAAADARPEGDLVGARHVEALDVATRDTPAAASASRAPPGETAGDAVVIGGHDERHAQAWGLRHGRDDGGAGHAAMAPIDR